MAGFFETIKTQWSEIKGNAKWDFIKLVAIGMIALIAAIIRFLGHAPLWQVLVVYVATFALVGFIFWIFQKREQPKPDSSNKIATASLQAGLLPRQTVKPEIVNVELVLPTKPPDKKIENKNDRIMLDVTPKYLVSLYSEHVTLQANALAKAYLGKWLKISAEFDDVRKVMDGRLMVSFGKPFLILSGVSVYAFFSKQWDDHLRTIRRGKKITVLGRVSSIDRSTVHLDDCEILSD